MGCTESVPVQEPNRTQVIYAQTSQVSNYKNEDPVNYNPKNQAYIYALPNTHVQSNNYAQPSAPPLYSQQQTLPPPNRPPPPYGLYNNNYVVPSAPPIAPLNYQQTQYMVYQYPNGYPNQYSRYNQQPSMLSTMGAVAGGVILGDIVSDALFD